MDYDDYCTAQAESGQAGPPIDSAPATQEAGPQGHAPYGPSKLHYLDLCPSFKSSKKTNAAADSGTRCHEAVETGKNEGLDEQELEAVEKISNYIKPFVEEATLVHKELKLDVSELTWGTADLVLCGKDHCHVMDYKFGRWAVPPVESNLQAWAYTIGAFLKFPNAQSVTFTILAPYRDEVDKHTFKRSELPAMLDRIRSVISRAKAAKEFNPHDTTCRFCARQNCPALIKEAAAVAKASGMEVAAIPDLTPANIDDPEVMAKCLQLAPILEKWCSDIKAFALAMRQEEGVEIPNYEIRSGRGKPSSKDGKVALEIAQEEGLTAEEFADCCDISAKQLADLIASKAKRGEKGKTNQRVRNALIDRGAVAEGKEYFYLAKTKNSEGKLTWTE